MSSPVPQEAYIQLLCPKLSFNSDRPLSASGCTLLREFFNEASPTILPMYHSTVAFNDRQIHTLLRVIYDESVTTSMHVVKTMLEEAMRVGALSQQNKLGQDRQKVRCFHGRSESSLGEENQYKDTVGGYRSGTLSSDDNFVTLEAGKTTRPNYRDFCGNKIFNTSTGTQTGCPFVTVGYSESWV